jgi:putative SOS response-associated peptidase YedK
MCGRYTLKTDPKMIAAQFSVSALAILDGAIADLTAPIAGTAAFETVTTRPNYNVAPTHQIPAILQHEDLTTIATFQWGLVPSWSKDPAIGSRMINARSETAAEKPSFRSAIVKRRCIVPADGWYEWHTNAGKKIPHYFSDPSESLIGFAGIFESWTQPDGEPLWTTAILTQQARPEFAHIHDRMPVLVAPELRTLWLAPGPNPLAQILEAAESTQIQEWEVAPAVGNVRNNSAELIANQTLF